MNVGHLKPVVYEIIHDYNDDPYTLRQLCVDGVYKWFILFKSSYKTVLTKDGLVNISQAIANKEYFDCMTSAFGAFEEYIKSQPQVSTKTEDGIGTFDKVVFTEYYPQDDIYTVEKVVANGRVKISNGFDRMIVDADAIVKATEAEITIHKRIIDQEYDPNEGTIYNWKLAPHDAVACITHSDGRAQWLSVDSPYVLGDCWQRNYTCHHTIFGSIRSFKSPFTGDWTKSLECRPKPATVDDYIILRVEKSESGLLQSNNKPYKVHRLLPDGAIIVRDGDLKYSYILARKEYRIAKYYEVWGARKIK